MNLSRYPDLLDRLAAAYALGTLRGGARRRFQALARQDAVIRAAALTWQERFAAMTELQLAQSPSPNVWKRVENLLAAESAAAPARPVAAPAAKEREPRGLIFWRGLAWLGVLATVSALAVNFNQSRELASRDAQLAEVRSRSLQLARQNTQLAQQLREQPEIRYVAVLADDKAAASLLVTFDPRRGTLTLKRVGDYQEAADKSLQLWALPPGSAPRSLGVLGADPVVKLTASDAQVREAPLMAVSLEPKGGVPGETGPTGPVLFKGAVLQTPL